MRSFYGAGVEAFMGLEELYIRSADEFACHIVGVDQLVAMYFAMEYDKTVVGSRCQLSMERFMLT